MEDSMKSIWYYTNSATFVDSLKGFFWASAAHSRAISRVGAHLENVVRYFSGAYRVVYLDGAIRLYSVKLVRPYVALPF